MHYWLYVYLNVRTLMLILLRQVFGHRHLMWIAAFEQEFDAAVKLFLWCGIGLGVACGIGDGISCCNGFAICIGIGFGCRCVAGQ